jgi:hypothetical protein
MAEKGFFNSARVLDETCIGLYQYAIGKLGKIDI